MRGFKIFIMGIHSIIYSLIWRLICIAAQSWTQFYYILSLAITLFIHLKYVNCLILDFVIIQYILILVIYTLIRKNNNNKIYHKCVRMLFNFCVKKVYRNILFFITERVTRYISIWWINSLLQRRSWWRKYTDCWNDLGISQYWIILNSK